jgi:hypothetical protein
MRINGMAAAQAFLGRGHAVRPACKRLRYPDRRVALR